MFFFYNSGWVLFIPGCDLDILVYFFATLNGCSLFLIVIWTLLAFFFTTLDGRCLSPIPHLQHHAEWHGHPHCPQQCTRYPNCGCVTTYVCGNIKIRFNTTRAKFWGRGRPYHRPFLTLKRVFSSFHTLFITLPHPLILMLLCHQVLGKRPPLSPTFSYSKTCLLFFPYIVHYPTPPLDTNVVVPPSLGEATPITNPVLLLRVSLNHSRMHRLPYPTRCAKVALTTM